MSVGAFALDDSVPVPQAGSSRLTDDEASSGLSSPIEDIDNTASGSSVLMTPMETPKTSQSSGKANKKRNRESSRGTSTKGAKKVKAGPVEVDIGDVGTASTKHVHCHHCRRKVSSVGNEPRGENEGRVHSTNYLTCTKATAGLDRKKAGRPYCAFAFCETHLERRYGTDLSTARGDPNTALLDEVHDRSGAYVWSCPHCQKQCQNAICLKMKQKKETAAIAEKRKSSPSLGFNPISSTLATSDIGPRPHDPTKKQRPSHAFSLDFDSDSSLTDDPTESAPPSSKRKKAKGEPKAKAVKQSGTQKAEKSAANGQVKPKAKIDGKSENGKAKPKGKGKAKDPMKPVEKKPRAKPVKKVEKPVEPPVFEKVDTRLGRVEAEQKIMLREYLYRFQPILSIPERSLPPLDDFDRPPTEASIKLFAGAMLDLIKEDLMADKKDDDEDIIDMVARFREELRYYGDLARFANAYKTLEDPLGLGMPKVVIAESRGSANMKAIRALLDLEEHEEIPAWAGAGPSRRTGASRLPQPSEVVRMLLALAERTLSSPVIRTDLGWEAPENEARRVHAREQKKENDQWEIKRKKLSADGVRCKSAAATKAHQELSLQETKEHAMRLALTNVNLRAALGTRALRHGPLGIDLDGRVYYCLAHRPIDDDVRPPHGWASGLLVWGVGLPAKPDTPVDEDELPAMVERWSHFGQSADVRQLVKWLEYRTRKAVEAAQPAGNKTPTKPKAAAATTPTSTTKGLNTPKTAGNSKQLTLDFRATPTDAPSKSAGKKKLLEVCIPVNKASRASSDDEERDSSTDSDLSELSEDGSNEELLSHLLPEGYQQSADILREEGAELAKKVAEVAEWLEVLEWKGMGEVVK